MTPSSLPNIANTLRASNIHCHSHHALSFWTLRLSVVTRSLSVLIGQLRLLSIILGYHVGLNAEVAIFEAYFLTSSTCHDRF